MKSPGQTGLPCAGPGRVSQAGWWPQSPTHGNLPSTDSGLVREGGRGKGRGEGRGERGDGGGEGGRREEGRGEGDIIQLAVTNGYGKLK